MIFKTFDNDIDKTSAKWGILGSSFNDIGSAIAERLSDINKGFQETGDVLGSIKNSDSIWKRLYPEKESIKSKMIDVDSIIPQIDPNNFDFNGWIDKLNTVDKQVKNGTLSWQDYSNELNDNEKWIAKWGQETEGQIRTQKDLINANRTARDATIAYNNVLKQQTLSAKAGQIALQAFATIGNMVAFVLISKGIELAVKGIDNLVHRAEKAKEAIDESTGAYESSKSELQSLQNELNTTAQRIDELNAKDKLTFTEQGELENLKAQNAELERSIELEKLKSKEKLNDATKEIADGYDDYREQFQSIESNNNTRQRLQDDIASAQQAIDNADEWLDGQDLEDYIADKQKQIQGYKQQLQKLGQAEKAAAKEKKAEYLDYASQLEDWISLYEEKGIDNLSINEKETYDTMVSDLDNIYKSVLSEGEYYDIKVKPMLADESLKESADQITEYFKNGGDIDGLEDAFSDDIIQALKTACENSGIPFTRFLENLYAQATDNTPGMSFAPIVSNPNSGYDAKMNQQSKEKIDYYNSLEDEIKGKIDAGEIVFTVEDSLEDCKRKVEEFKNNVEETSVSIDFVTSIGNAKSGFDALQNAYTDFADGRQIGASNLSGLKDTFGGLPNFDEYIDAVTDVESTTEDIQDAFDNLATSYIDNCGLLDNLTRENAEYIASQLELMGIVNSKEFIEGRLADKYGLESQAQQELINTSNALGNAKYNASNASQTLANATIADIIALANEASQAGVANNALVSLAMAKMSSNGIITAAECDALAALASQAGIAADVFYELAAAKRAAENGTLKSSGSAYADDMRMRGLEANAKNAAAVANYKLTHNTASTSYGGSYSGSSGGGGGSSSYQSTSQIDWISRKLEQVQKAIDITKEKFENLFKFKEKTSNLTSQIKQTQQLLEANTNAAESYKQSMDGLDLGEELIDAVKNGAYSISEYESSTAELINQYKSYYDSYTDAIKQIEKLEAEIRNLQKQRAQLHVDRAKSQLDKLDAYMDISTGYKKSNKYINQQIKQTKESYKYQIKIAKVDGDMVKVKQLQAERQKAIIDLQKKKYDNIQKYYDKQVELIDIQETALKDQISLLETKGITVTAEYYEKQITQENKKQEQLKEERRLLKEQLKNIRKGTDAWYEAKNALADVNAQLRESKETVAEINNSITELADNTHENLLSNLNNVTDTMEWVANLMSNRETFDSETGMITSEGLATLGTYTSNYQSAKQKASLDEKLIRSMEDNYKKGVLEFTDSNGKKRSYNSLEQMRAAIDELYGDWRDQISSVYNYENQIVDMMTAKLKAELQALQNLIDAKKDALKAEKDLHDYQKSIRDSTQNISSLQKQIAAVSGDTSEEGLMRIQKLQKQLADAQEELDEKEYERYISDQEDMLDKLVSEYEDLMQAEMQDTDKLLEEGFALVSSNLSSILETLDSYVSKYGYDTNESTYTKGTDNMETGNTSGGSSASGVTFNSSEGVSRFPAQTDSPSISEPKSTVMETALVNTLSATSIKTKKQALEYINKKADTATKQRGAYSDVNKSIYDYTGGKVLTVDELKKFAKRLGLIYDNNLTESGALYQKLKSLKLPKFAKGGLVKRFAQAQGEDGIGMVREGEYILTPDVGDTFIHDFIPQMNDFIDTSRLYAAMPSSLVTPDIPDTANIEATYNFTLENCTNAEDMIRQIQQSPKVQSALQEVTVNRLGGRATRLSVNKIK